MSTQPHPGYCRFTTVTDGVNLVLLNPSIDCEVKVFGVQTQLHDQDDISIGSDNFFIKGDFGDYSGTKLDLG